MKGRCKQMLAYIVAGITNKYPFYFVEPINNYQIDNSGRAYIEDIENRYHFIDKKQLVEVDLSKALGRISNEYRVSKSICRLIFE